MLRDKIISAIEEVGFDEYREIKSSELIFADHVVISCEKNTCGNYGQNYSCPPLSGNRQENMDRFLAYENAIILNKLMYLGKYYELMKECTADVVQRLNTLAEMLRGEPVMLAGPGGCHLCEVCGVKTDEPCRHPDYRISSMSGSGMDTVAMSRKLNMIYNAGNNTVGYFLVVMY